MACAFQLGFNGVIQAGTPAINEGFSIRETAKCAGFKDAPDLGDKEYLQALVDQARD